MKKIIIDTNFLLVPFQFGIDIFKEFDKIVDEKYSLYTLSSCIEELKKVKPSLLKAVLELIKIKDVEIIKTKERYADKEIIKLAKKDDFWVATNDKILKQKLLKNKATVLFLRQKSYIEKI
jgi:hypothetical protein